jgi:hypothetical protein
MIARLIARALSLDPKRSALIGSSSLRSLRGLCDSAVNVAGEYTHRRDAEPAPVNAEGLKWRLNSRQSILLQSPVERAATQAERFRGPIGVAFKAGQRFRDQQTFGFLEAHLFQTRRQPRFGR